MELSCVVIIVVIYVVSIIIYLSIRQCYLLLYRNCKFEFVFSRKKITKESQTLRFQSQHCGKSVRMRSYSGMRENVDQNNSEYGHFIRSARC